MLEIITLHEVLTHRRNDVRVGMRGENEIQVLRRKVALHRHDQAAVGHVSAGIDQCTVPVVGDQKLVALDSVVCAFIDQVVEGKADMLSIVVEFDGHGLPSSGASSPEALPFCRNGDRCSALIKTCLSMSRVTSARVRRPFRSGLSACSCGSREWMTGRPCAGGLRMRMQVALLSSRRGENQQGAAWSLLESNPRSATDHAPKVSENVRNRAPCRGRRRGRGL